MVPQTGASRLTEFTVEIYKGIWTHIVIQCATPAAQTSYATAPAPRIPNKQNTIWDQNFLKKSEIEFVGFSDPIKEVKRAQHLRKYQFHDTRTRFGRFWSQKASTELIYTFFVAQMLHRPLILHKTMFWGCAQSQTVPEGIER